MRGLTVDLDSRIVPSEWASIGRRLAREFTAPVALLDPKGPRWYVDPAVEICPTPESALSWANSEGILESHRAALWTPDGDEGPTWLGLSIPINGETEGLALAAFAGSQMTERKGLGPPCPENALKAWGQSVADSLRADSALRPVSPHLAGEDYQLIARLVRRLKISDPPERFQGLAASALRATLRIWAVAWVPLSSREQVVVGGPDPLGTTVWRGLAAEGVGHTVHFGPTHPYINHTGVESFAIIASEGQSPPGHIVAVDASNHRKFSSGEVAILQAVASMIGTQRTNGRIYSDLKELLFGVIRALTAAIDAKDPYTSGHSERVARMAARIGEELGMHSNQKSDLYLMGLLHDVGKIGINDSVLKKAGPLTPDEYRVIQSHVEIGVKILSEMKKLNHLLPGVAGHHESLDGKGYPAGLMGEAIPIEARILAVADSFDAMSSTRPYRRRLSPSQITEIFRKGAGVQWDPRVVEALFNCHADLESIRQKGLGDSLQDVVRETLNR